MIRITVVADDKTASALLGLIAERHIDVQSVSSERLDEPETTKRRSRPPHRTKGSSLHEALFSAYGLGRPFSMDTITSEFVKEGYNPGTVRSVISRLATRGFIERNEDNVKFVKALLPRTDIWSKPEH